MSLTDLADRKEIAPFISFERKAIEDKQKSLQYGRYIAKDVDYVTIHSPYSRDTVIYPVDKWLENSEEKVMRGSLKQEWFEDWKKKHSIWLSRQASPANGTPVRGWGVLSPAQQETVISLDVLTVEDIVRSDKMHLIEGGKEIKQKAVTWLQALNDRGPLIQKLSELTAENDRLKEVIKTFEEKLNAKKDEKLPEISLEDNDPVEIDLDDLLSPHEIVPHETLEKTNVTPIAKRRGRPPKVKE